MSQDVSGPRLLLYSPPNFRTSLEKNRRYLRFAVLLVAVMVALIGAGAVRAASDDAVAFLQHQSDIVQNLTVVLIASALALVVLGAYRRITENANRQRRTATTTRVLSVTSGSAVDVWKAQEEERKQISRELHDSVGQLLTATGLQLRALRSNRLLPEELRCDFEETCKLNAEALRQVRDLAMGLRPALLDDVSLVAALEWQVRQFSRQTGIPAIIEAHGDSASLPENHRVCIYRCVQEALTNCAKHAHARSVHVYLTVSDTEANLTIEDDGIGVNDSQSATGIGLLGMRERVAGLRGRFSVAPRSEGGTALTFQIPVPGDVLA
jgi:signal transduction histidine kinase